MIILKKVEEKIKDEKFMKAFVKLTNYNIRGWDAFDKVYSKYRKILSDDEIMNLLDYCEEKDLFEFN
jgi:hypothetical protein